MNELTRYLVESVLNESIQKTVVVYGGRFQPFHKGHYATYSHLVSKFGGDNVYIATSNSTDSSKSPFNFKEKKAIMTTMFGIPSGKIVQTRNAYSPVEILNKYDGDTTALVAVTGKKDASRLLGYKYYKPYKGAPTKGFDEVGYAYIAPEQSGPISGTEVRQWLSTGTDAQKRKSFLKAYPKFDEKVYKLITSKLSKNKNESKGKTINQILSESIGNKSLLNEGGAYGHMHHPFDIEMNLTFGDLKNIVSSALSGNLELAREKTDGQALAVSWVNGRLVAARNKSHTKNKGASAMDAHQVAKQFSGRGTLADAYNFAMKDLASAIGGLSDKQKKKIFKDGACFMNLEVIYPQNANVIPYGQNLLVFHGTYEYDINGNIVGENQEAASTLAGMIKQINQHVQSTYAIQGPPIQKLPKSEKLSAKQSKYIGMIGKLQKEFGLSDSDGVASYHQAWWRDFVDKKAAKLDEQSKIGLVKRWAFGDKSFRISTIDDPKIKEWAEKTDKENHANIVKKNLMRFEEIFLGVGAEVLSFMTSVLTVNPDDAARKMRGELESVVKQIKASGNPAQLQKLKTELGRLNSLGGFEKIVPTEGIVFVYGGNTYKLTGAFAPLNQIMGIFKFSR